MDVPGAKEQRRKAIRVLTRLSSAHSGASGIGRDAGPNAFLAAVESLRVLLTDAEERAALQAAHRDYATASGRPWPELTWPDSAQAAPASAPLPGVSASDSAQAAPADAAVPEVSAAAAADWAAAQTAEAPRIFRVQGKDVGLTFNHDWVPQGTTVQEWWPSGGVAIVSAFQTWALQDLVARFRGNKTDHVSLTMEQSLQAPQPKVHLHAQITFKKTLDLSTTDLLCFGSVRPHVEVNHARGKGVEKSRARAHFYVVCLKEGSLWHYTDWIPFSDYAVDPLWLTGWWATGKFSHDQYRKYLLKARRSYRGNVLNFEAVAEAERAEGLQAYRDAVLLELEKTKLPFRLISDPLFPKLAKFVAQFDTARERYTMYALQGPSQAAKTSFVKTLFKNPYIVTIQGEETLNLKGFQYGTHGALVLDNIVDFDLILRYRALLQANTDVHRLGESATGMYSYSVFLWAVPIILTVDLDVDATGAIAASEWLTANVLHDVLPRGTTCYVPGPRNDIPMASVPSLADYL